MTSIRAFIAVYLTDEVKNALGEIARSLSQRLPSGGVRWVRPEQMHLTLRFLGDTTTDRLPVIQTALDDVAGRCTPFVMHLDGIGCFPSLRRPRVVWVGLGGEVERLAALKAVLDASLTPLGWPPEDKPFRAHMTLGRVKDEHAAQQIDWSLTVPPLAVPIAAIHLIESILYPHGPNYTTRHSSILGKR